MSVENIYCSILDCMLHRTIPNQSLQLQTLLHFLHGLWEIVVGSAVATKAGKDSRISCVLGLLGHFRSAVCEKILALRGQEHPLERARVSGLTHALFDSGTRGRNLLRNQFGIRCSGRLRADRPSQDPESSKNRRNIGKAPLKKSSSRSYADQKSVWRS